MKALNIFKTATFFLSILLFLISLLLPIQYLIGEPSGESGVRLELLGVFYLFLDIGWDILLLIPYSLSEGQNPHEYFVNIFVAEKIISWATPILLLAWIFSLINQKTALLYALIVSILTIYLFVTSGVQTSKIEHLGIGYWFWAGSVLFCNIGLILGIATEGSKFENLKI